MTENLFYVGVDLGQIQDYTAVAVLEKKIEFDDTVLNGGFRILSSKPSQSKTKFNVVWLERFTLGTEYPIIVKRVATILEHPDLDRDTKLIIDKTGVGVAVCDMFKAKDITPVGITITSGLEVTEKPDGYHVPKKELVTSLLALFQSERLKIAEELELADVLKDELENFKVKTNTRTGNEQFEAWRATDHDDLVLAVALSVWYATQCDGRLDDFVDPDGVRKDYERHANYDPLHRNEKRDRYDPLGRR